MRRVKANEVFGGSVTLKRARELTDQFVASAVEPVKAGDVVVTHSELDTFRQCPLKHHLAYRLGWNKKPAAGHPLTRGTLWHNVMESYYTQLGKTPAADRARNQWRYAYPARDWARDLWLLNPEGNSNEDQSLADWMLQGYVDFWGADPSWETLAVEKVGRLRMRDPRTGRRTKYLFMFKLDLLVWVGGRVVLVDHKSASNFSRPNEVAIADQFGSYTWALRELGVPVWQTIRNDARTQRNVGDRDGTRPMPLDTRFQRLPTYRTDTELKSIAVDLLSVARTIYGNQGAPVYSSPDPGTCTWKCPFFDAHLLARKGVPIEQTLHHDSTLYQAERKHDYYPSEQQLTEQNQGEK